MLCVCTLGLLGTELIGFAAFSPAPPPVAPIRPVTDDCYGTKTVDHYRYVENPGFGAEHFSFSFASRKE